MIQYLYGFYAGMLSILAPCVLPVLPLVITSSLKTSKYGPILNALGLALVFSIVGILTNVFASFFDPEYFRKFGAVILIITGIFFLVPKNLISNFKIFNIIANIGHKLQSKTVSANPLSELLTGALLALVWSPCVGPTLGLAVGLASQSDEVVKASGIFFAFGLGAGLSLVAFGYLFKSFKNLNKTLISISHYLYPITGTIALVLGFLILFGGDVIIEEFLLSLLPDFIVNLSTKF